MRVPVFSAGGHGSPIRPNSTWEVLFMVNAPDPTIGLGALIRFNMSFDGMIRVGPTRLSLAES